MKLLVPVDGSEAALHAARHAIRLASWLSQAPEIHVLNVQPALPADVTRFVSRDDVESFHREAADKCMASALALFAEAGLPATPHVAVGHAADTIARVADELGVDEIIAGTRGTGLLARFLMGSVATRLPQASRVPVLLVP